MGVPLLFVHLSIHLPVDMWVLPTFGYCESCCSEHVYTRFCLNTCFQLFWVPTQEWNFWVMWDCFEEERQ